MRGLALAALLVLGLAAPAQAEGCVEAFLTRDYNRALELCPAEREDGEAGAFFAMGGLAEMGINGKPDLEEAERGYRAAALRGFVPAQTVLGFFLLRRAAIDDANCGDLVRESTKWFAAAADRGYAPAQVQHGLAVLDSRGTRPDPVLASRRFRAAAAQGSPDGMFLLAGLYRIGSGVPQDWSAAIFLYHEAADRGHPAAAHNLAVALETLGLSEEAASWRGVASRNGLGFSEASANVADQANAPRRSCR